MLNPRKSNLLALNYFSEDSEDEAKKNDESENSLQQLTSQLIEEEDEKINGKTA